MDYKQFVIIPYIVGTSNKWRPRPILLHADEESDWGPHFVTSSKDEFDDPSDAVSAAIELAKSVIDHYVASIEHLITAIRGGDTWPGDVDNNATSHVNTSRFTVYASKRRRDSQGQMDPEIFERANLDLATLLSIELVQKKYTIDKVTLPSGAAIAGTRIEEAINAGLSDRKQAVGQ